MTIQLYKAAIRQILGNAMFCEELGYSHEDIEEIKVLSC